MNRGCNRCVVDYILVRACPASDGYPNVTVIYGEPCIQQHTLLCKVAWRDKCRSREKVVFMWAGAGCGNLKKRQSDHLPK